jgi:hypothetical protein
MGKNIKSKRKGINNRSRTRRQRGGGVTGVVTNTLSTLPGHDRLFKQLKYIQGDGITKVALEAPVKVAATAVAPTAAEVEPTGVAAATEVQVSPLVLAKIAINIELFENDGIKLKPFTIGCFRNFKQYGSPHTELIFSKGLSKLHVNEISRFADCFQNVELLDLRNTEITKLPMNFSKLISLKCLLLPKTIISNNFYDLAVKVQTLRYIEVPGIFEKEKTRIERKPELTQEQKNKIMAKEIEIETQEQTPEQIQEQKNEIMAEGLADEELIKTLTKITALEEKININTGEAIDIDSDILKLFNEDEKITLKKIERPLAIYNEDKLKENVIRILSNKKTELKIKNFRIPPDDSDSPVQESVDSGIIFEAPSLLEQFREDPVKKQDIQTEQDIKITQIVTGIIANTYSGKILCFPPSWPEDYEPSLIVSSEEESIYDELKAE